MSILFSYDYFGFRLKGSRMIKEWLNKVINSHNKRIGRIQFVFVSDDRLLDMNRQFLNHDYFTDIITFDYCEKGLICGEIYISVDRVRENADSMKIDFYDEMLRVLAHGVLHLIGFKDGNPAQKRLMREAEDKALSLRVLPLLAN